MGSSQSFSRVMCWGESEWSDRSTSWQSRGSPSSPPQSLQTDIWTGVPAGVPCLTSLVTGVLTRGDRQVQTGGLTGGRSRVCSSSRPSVPPGLAQSYCQPLRHVGTAPPVATVQYITVLYCTVQSVAAGFQPSVGLGGRAPHVSETVSGCHAAWLLSANPQN